MAGSRVDAQYTTDDGLLCFISVDKSNFSQANGEVTIPAIATNALPRNYKPRYAIYRSDDRLYTIKVPVVTSARMAALPPAINNYAGTSCKLVNRVPEKRRAPMVADTGITNP